MVVAVWIPFFLQVTFSYLSFLCRKGNLRCIAFAFFRRTFFGLDESLEKQGAWCTRFE